MTIVAALVILIFGVRYLEGIPLRGTYPLYTEFPRVDGLLPGNSVQISGVSVGTVTEVGLNQETQRVRVDMQINRGIVIPEGTTAEQSGLSAISTVSVSFDPGPSDNPPIPSGGYVPAQNKPDLFTTLVDRVDSTLIGTTRTFQEMAELLQEPTSDLRETLTSVANLTDDLAKTLNSERRRISNILKNVEGLTGRVDTLAASGKDSLDVLMGEANRSLEEVQAALEQVNRLGLSLDRVLIKIDTGQGTLGLLVNDENVYRNLDSTLVNLNRLLVDFRTNPERYLKELKIVDLL